jgi:signal peptidase I
LFCEYLNPLPTGGIGHSGELFCAENSVNISSMAAHVSAMQHSMSRTFIQGGVWIALAAVLVETWFLDGLVVPYRIEGGSMAGALLGPHRNAVCGDCGCPFSVGIDVASLPACAVCPNCGYAANPIQSLPDVIGDRVLIDRTAFSTRAPQRWEIVAFRHPSQGDAIVVKRLIGLPGESVEIRGGDIYVNGQIARKDLAQQHALAVLVYDADFAPTKEALPPPRWRPERSDTRWTSDGGRFERTSADPNEPIDWLAYHHWRRQPLGIRESPVADLSGYNQSQPRREEDVHAVCDLLLSLRLRQVAGSGAFCVRATDGRRGFQLQLRFDEHSNPCEPEYRITALLPKDGSPVLSGGRPSRRDGSSKHLLETSETAAAQPIAEGRLPAAAGERLLEVSLVDRQFLVAVDGRTIVAYPYDGQEPSSATPCPLAIGARGLAVTIAAVRVYRDVYYTHPLGPTDGVQNCLPIRLAADEYYVLGDNGPVSQDSRTWPTPRTVDHNSLLGKPLVAIPSTTMSLGRLWHFQVPHSTGIRYIR